MESTKRTDVQENSNGLREARLEALKKALAAAKLTDYEVDLDEHECSVRIPVDGDEEVVVEVGDGTRWAYELAWVHWTPATREHPTEPTEYDLADIDDPELAVVLIQAAIVKYEKEQEALAAAVEPGVEEQGVHHRMAEKYERLAEVQKSLAEGRDWV
ncbi:hypothetical protein ACWDTT_15850 [Streptosporangium sandarakinum]